MCDLFFDSGLTQKMKNKDALLMSDLFFAYTDPKPMKLKD